MNEKRSKALSRALAALVLIAAIASSAPGAGARGRAAAGDIIRVSVSSGEVQANSYSRDADLSDDGRFVAFWSGASNLVAGDTNEFEDIFVRDIQAGETTRVSVSSAGAQADQSSYYPAISGDGRYIAFMSDATNLVSGDTNGVSDIFVHDRQTATTTRVSLSSGGAQADQSSDSFVAISGNGRFVAFASEATNLVSGDTNGVADLFVHDRQTGATERISLDSNEAQANGGSANPSLSADGRFVAFTSSATNLVGGDTNTRSDVFVRDRQSGLTTRVSVNSSGVQADRDGHDPAISGDGRYVAFSSLATNLLDEEPYGYEHVYVHDRLTGATTLASIETSGWQLVGTALRPDISSDGRFVVYEFEDRGDGLGFWAIYLHDRLTGITTNVSGPGGGEEDSSFGPSISGNAVFAAFSSFNSGLVPGDTNEWNDVFRLELAIPVPVTQIYQSIGTYDGWVIESGENSNEGTRIDAGANTLFLGDASNDQQYRSILHFATASLPNNAIITNVTLKVKRQSIAGDNPFSTHGDLLVDIRKPYFDPIVDLQAVDFQAPADQEAIGIFESAPGALWYTAALDPAAFPFIDRTGTTQFRLRFALDDDNDDEQDIIKFFSGDAASADQPVLTVDYFLPAGGSSSIFGDVPEEYWAWSFIERLYNAGITGGCGVNPLVYCPEGTVTRAQMAVFLLRGIHGSTYSPPAVGASTGFSDVPTDYWAAPWIKQLAAEGITAGCGNNNYCPESAVSRAEMAVFLLRSKHGAGYNPPAVGTSTGFDDVDPAYWAAAWIKQLVAEGIATGCGASTYCPADPVTRAQMAVFLVRTFNLP